MELSTEVQLKGGRKLQIRFATLSLHFERMEETERTGCAVTVLASINPIPADDAMVRDLADHLRVQTGRDANELNFEVRLPTNNGRVIFQLSGFRYDPTSGNIELELNSRARWFS